MTNELCEHVARHDGVCLNCGDSQQTPMQRMAGLVRMLQGQREFESGHRRRGWDQQLIDDEMKWFVEYWRSLPCIECGGKKDDDGDGEKCHICCEYPSNRGEAAGANAVADSSR